VLPSGETIDPTSLPFETMDIRTGTLRVNWLGQEFRCCLKSARLEGGASWAGSETKIPAPRNSPVSRPARRRRRNGGRFVGEGVVRTQVVPDRIF
jgi:hypothetical protein